MNALLGAMYDEVIQRKTWSDTPEVIHFYDRIIAPNTKVIPNLENDYWEAMTAEGRSGFEAGFYAALELLGLKEAK